MTAQASPARATIAVWDLPVRLFHWLLVGAIAVAFLSSEDDSPIADWHMRAGWLAAVLIAFRLVWGLVGGEHARFANFVRPSHALSHLTALFSGRGERAIGHNPAGGLAVLLLIGGVVAVVTTGWLTFQGGDKDLHETIAWLLLGLVGIHVAAVIVTSIASRENLVRAMVTGRKAAADHPGARDACSAGPVALLIALAAVGGAVAGIVTLDRDAFGLQDREAHERHADSAISFDYFGEGEGGHPQADRD